MLLMARRARRRGRGRGRKLKAAISMGKILVMKVLCRS